MGISKEEQKTKLRRALAVREAELEENEAVVRRAMFRSKSLREAIDKLRNTIAKLDESSEVAVPPTEPLVRNEGATSLTRVQLYIESANRIVSATEIAEALNIGIDSTRTMLSKLHANGRIVRFGRGEYASLEYTHAPACEEP